MRRVPPPINPAFTFCSCGGVGFDKSKAPKGFSATCGGCGERVGVNELPKLIRVELQLKEDLLARLDAKRGLVQRATFIRALIESACK